MMLAHIYGKDMQVLALKFIGDRKSPDRGWQLRMGNTIHKVLTVSTYFQSTFSNLEDG